MQKSLFQKLTGVFAFALILIVTPIIVLAGPVSQDSMDSDITCSEEYIVQAGDWLSKLAEKYYGDILAYPAIVEATNAKNTTDETFANIANADLIEVGWKLCIPEGTGSMMMTGSMQAP